ncbi:MAG: SusC/RagA family TonB-linked outer membrane protein, partial [Chitinophagaceae bacterium]
MKTIYKKLLFILLLMPLAALAQGTLSGTILEKATNLPLPGVNVVVQGTTNGTTSDMDGKFQLRGLQNGNVLVFTYIGFAEQKVTYTGQANISVTMDEDSNQLQEVVVQVGYGTTTKKDATGSVSVVTSADFNKGTIASADQLLTGRTPGVRITSDGGRPDAAPNIRIRGGSSLSAGNNPLIVIDGVALDYVNPAGVANPLSLVNPNDIESFSILKDASATAIYGARASNGVIIITTKRGTSGKPQFNFSSTTSIGKALDEINVMD